MPNTGYSINKNQVVRAQQTKAIIDYFVDKEYLIKTGLCIENQDGKYLADRFRGRVIFPVY